MSVKINLDGLRKLERCSRELYGTHRVPVSQLLTPRFMRGHTPFGSFEALAAASPFAVNSAEDFQAIPDGEWDAYIRQHTRFSSWRELLSAAGAGWIKGRLFP